MCRISNSDYISAIKQAAGSVQYEHLSVQQTFLQTVSQLYWYFEQFQEKRYLNIALLHIEAYLEMGFSYNVASEVFDQVLEGLGTTREQEFPKRFYHSHRIRLNKTQVRSMINKWPASPHQKMKINELVEDIMEKVRSERTGIFCYKCAVTGDRYELVINEKEVFFRDIRRGIFYTFYD